VPVVERHDALDPRSLPNAQPRLFAPPPGVAAVLGGGGGGGDDDDATAGGGGTHDFMFDGILFSDQGRQDDAPSSGYVLVFRSGAVEVGIGEALDVRERGAGRSTRLFRGRHLVATVVGSVPRYLRGLAGAGIAPPYVLMLTFVGVRGAWMLSEDGRIEGAPADREVLALPPVLLETTALAEGWEAALRPRFDMLWQAFGLEACPYYTERGVWRRA
jgi:hypothetical protein